MSNNAHQFQGQRSSSVTMLRLKVYHIYRKEGLGTSKLVRRLNMPLYQMPRPAIKVYEVEFLHTGGGIPCRLVVYNHC